MALLDMFRSLLRLPWRVSLRLQMIMKNDLNGGDVIERFVILFRRLSKMFIVRRKGGNGNGNGNGNGDEVGIRLSGFGLIVVVLVVLSGIMYIFQGWLGIKMMMMIGKSVTYGAGSSGYGASAYDSWNGFGRRGMRIIIVVNRRESLAVRKTLESLENGWGLGRGRRLMGNVDLEVWLFRNASKGAVRVSSRYRWRWGQKNVRVVPGVVGTYEMWLGTGWGKGLEEIGADHGRIPTLFVESGTELAGGWQRWLLEAGRRYSKEMDVAGFTLDAVRVRRKGPGNIWTPLKVSPVKHSAFLYRLTDGVSTYMPNWNPNSDVWATFREYVMIRKADWYRFPELKDRDTPTAPDSPASNYTMAHWSAWFTQFQAEYRLYTLYANLPQEKTLAFNPYVPKPHHLRIRDDEFTVLQESYAPVVLPTYKELKRIETDGELVVRHSDKQIEKIEKYAMSLSTHDKLISFTMVNRVFLDTTRSWLCNVDIPNMRPPNIVWITTDHDTHRTLSRVEGTLSVFLGQDGGSKDGSGLEFGNPGYWKLMLDRTRLIGDILDRGIALFNFETDAIWLADPLEHVNNLVKSGADIVGTINTRNEISGNFFYLKPTLATRHLWHEVVVSFEKAYEKEKFERKSKNSWTYIENDQSILTKLVLRNETWRMSYPIVFLTLDTQKFADGRWYMPEQGWYKKDREKTVIIQNNFVVGVQKKTERAKKWKHWFWKESQSSCDEQLVKSAVGLSKKNPVDLGHL